MSNLRQSSLVMLHMQFELNNKFIWYFSQLEVVDRGSKTQFKMAGNVFSESTKGS